MILQLSHPAPVSHVPPRSRKPRLSWIATASPAEVPECDEAAFEAVELGAMDRHGWVGEPRLHLRDGVAYRRLDLGYGRGPLRPERFLAWLRGELPFADSIGVSPRDPASVALQEEFLQTPLVARVPFKAGHGREGLTADRGAAVPQGGLGRTTDDGRSRAGSDAARFVAEGILVTGSSVYRRYRPIAQEGPDGSWAARDRPSVTVSLDHQPAHGLRLPVRADAIGAAAALRGREPGPVDPALSRMLAALPGSAHGDDDLPPVLAGLSREMGRYLRIGRSVLLGRGLAFDGEAERTLDAVRALERLAATGAFFPERVPAAIDALRAAATVHRQHEHGRSLSHGARTEALDAIDGHLGWIGGARPGGSEPPEADIDALASAGP